MPEEDKGGGDGNFPLDRRKVNETNGENQSNNGNGISSTYVRREFEKILYNNEMKIDTYRVIIQKKRIENQRPSISQLKIGDILYRKMKIGENIVETKKIGRNRIIAICRNCETANLLVESEELKTDHEVFVPFSFISRAAVVRNIDVEYSEEELKDELESGQYKILSVNRMRRRMFKDGIITFGMSESVKIFFEGCEFPRAVYLWGVRLECEPFMPPLIQCYRCLRYNHTTRQCKGAKVCKVCGSKDEQHECNSPVESCINCRGLHKADSMDCPEKKRQKTIKEMMAFQNLSLMEATAMMPRVNQRDTFSVVTSNRFQLLDNYGGMFPEIGQSRPTQPTERARIFEPYRPTAQARRRIGGTENEPRRKQNENAKRRRFTPNSSPKQVQQEKKLCTENRSTPQREDETLRNKSQNLVGYEALRQDRNYSKYEEGNRSYQNQKQQESDLKDKKNKKFDSRETLIDLNLNSSEDSVMSQDVDIVMNTCNTGESSAMGVGQNKQ